MKLKSLNVGNFLNFERVSIDLTNQNVVFGMNDVGKTNLLFAIRFLLDRDLRKNGYRDQTILKM
ncbi:AAA family ATPase [Viridibacillus arvi]|uniref:AAA family ATPase n=1 Tax=Viridibacillus arvi TaxID=263475 RepID=UPI003D041E2D